MRFQPLELEGVILVEPDVWRDARGFFLETYHEERYRAGGIAKPFVQDNHSYSEGPILRGLHAQVRRPQGKLVRAIQGKIFDVAVDIRPDSPTFGRWVSAELSDENFHQLYIPPGYAHGFCVLSATAHVQYKCTALYDREDEVGIVWNDPDIGIEWPVRDPVLNDKDRNAARLAEIVQKLRQAGP